MSIFLNDKPVYKQLVDQVKIDIFSHTLNPRDKLLSVRELALKYSVNPNTVQKALNELENIGLIYTERTNGKYVTDDVDLIEKLKNEYVNDKIKSFLDNLDLLGYDIDQVMKLLNEYKGG